MLTHSSACAPLQLRHHGTRYLMSGSAKEMKKAVEKPQAANTYNHHRLHFLGRALRSRRGDFQVLSEFNRTEWLFPLCESCLSGTYHLVCQKLDTRWALLRPRSAGPRLINFSAGFSTASKRAYLTKVDLVTRERLVALLWFWYRAKS